MRREMRARLIRGRRRGSLAGRAAAWRPRAARVAPAGRAGGRQPRSVVGLGVALEVVLAAQAGGGRHQQRAVDAVARAHQQQARAAGGDGGRLAVELGEVYDAVERAAHVGEAAVPRAGERDGRQRRRRQDLAGFGQRDQPVLAAALEAEQPAMLRRLRLGEAAGEPLLEFAQVAAGHVAQPIARMRASSSSWSTGFTR